MSRLPLVVRRRMKVVRKHERRKAQRKQAQRDASGVEMNEAFTAFNPPTISKTQAKRLAREQVRKENRDRKKMRKLNQMFFGRISDVFR